MRSVLGFGKPKEQKVEAEKKLDDSPDRLRRLEERLDRLEEEPDRGSLWIMTRKMFVGNKSCTDGRQSEISDFQTIVSPPFYFSIVDLEGSEKAKSHGAVVNHGTTASRTTGRR